MCTVAEPLKEYSTITLYRHSVLSQQSERCASILLEAASGFVAETSDNRVLILRWLRNAIQFAKAFATRIGATCIALEENPSTARVIVKQHDIPQTPQLSMDFAQFRRCIAHRGFEFARPDDYAMAIAFENVGRC